MAAMPIYSKNPSKIYFYGTVELSTMKLGTKHQGLDYYNVFIKYDAVMALTDFTARPGLVAFGNSNGHPKSIFIAKKLVQSIFSAKF